MLDIITVGPKFSGSAYHLQPTVRIARRCTALLLARAAHGTDRRKDGQTDMAPF